MAILVDPPRWPAHGTTWAHLVSDESLEELHAFARRTGLPARSFDLDHYDVPAERVPHLVAAGARPVPGRELLARLRAAGLRVRAADRPAARTHARDAELAERWAAARPGPVLPERWAEVGGQLLDRWREPHRSYHGPGHLHDVLANLDTLAAAGEDVPATVVLAAWFHDAVHDGVAGQDEERSAALAGAWLTGVVSATAAAEVVRLVRLTATHAPAPDDRAGAALCDADLAILAAPPARYARYAADVRAEYAQVPDPDFRCGRSQVLAGLLEREAIFTTAAGHGRWEQQARANLAAELADLAAAPPPDPA
ncbi:DUF4031 domain-containing protein [Georgenia sp. TF02-10]|uniref:DUF4031 domain-containing protein n=1 Tax=Georgenia sp. TF02-10 TaxID=2917725 RepID=UPI001FA714D2|nr:DUF4031 domain-containing protein [Georgenia sp. TF02-10]UNX55307.1 DUF4031 domain-containing protein [Georgenia sp. TF02-10]